MKQIVKLLGENNVADREDVVVAIVDAAGGELTGKVRLQKLVYLLDQLGLKSGFKFDYHHYGPFSRDLVNATEDAKAFGLIEEESRWRSSDLAMFSVFRKKPEAAVKREAFGTLGEARSKALIADLARRDATILELAATVHWLWRYEKRADWRAEISRRKGLKVQNGRLDRALELLTELKLSPVQ